MLRRQSVLRAMLLQGASMGGYLDDRKYIRSGFIADRRVSASLRLSF
ncbi:hypothetical protein [Caulobacter sp. Root655]|nr:hypothetical protein [Caulobacter sp. Root655]